jgi:tetratricopeptide (TPR) repeat protein
MPLTLSLLLLAGLIAPRPGQPEAAPCPPPDDIPVVATPLDDALSSLRRCVRADLRRGAWDLAERRLDAALEAPDAPAAWRSLVDRLAATRIVDARAWTQAPELAASFRESTPWLASMVTGIADARLAWRTQDAEAFDRILDTARTLAAEGDASRDLEVARAARLLQAAVAGGQYERDEMQLLLDEADATETALRHALGDAYVPVVIARELEGDLLLQTDRYEAAVAAYEAVVRAYPSRVQPWLGLADAHERLGNVAAAARCRQVAVTMAPGFAFEPEEGLARGDDLAPRR